MPTESSILGREAERTKEGGRRRWSWRKVTSAVQSQIADDWRLASVRKCRKITFDTWFGMEKWQRRAKRRESGRTRDGRGRKIGKGCRRYVIIRHRSMRSLTWPKAQIYRVRSDLMTSKANRWSVWSRRCSPTTHDWRRRIKLCDWLAPMLMGSTENRFRNGLASFSQSFIGLVHNWEAVHLWTLCLHRIYIDAT